MRNVKFLLILLVVIATSVACTRSASEAPAATEPSGENQLEAILNAAATQTAQASGLSPEGIGGGASPDDEAALLTTTPVPQIATATATVQPTNTPIPEPTVPDKYTLHKGEFPYCLARRFDVDVATLLSTNGLGVNSVVSEGLTLTIPKGSGGFPGERSLLNHPADYTVQSGDTIYSIACKFGDVFPEEIAAANNTKVDASLTVGDKIRIP